MTGAEGESDAIGGMQLYGFAGEGQGIRQPRADHAHSAGGDRGAAGAALPDGGWRRSRPSDAGRGRVTTDPDGVFPGALPAAFRAALTDRLKNLAASSAFTVAELQRQFAYDRLLARIFRAPDAQRWVLKGATALLARLDVARHSKDVDLAWQSASDLVEAEHALRRAADQDLGDFFVFELGPAAPLVGDKGLRVPVVADLGGRPFASFSVDVVAGQTMTAVPDLVPPLVEIEIPGLLRVDYRTLSAGRSCC